MCTAVLSKLANVLQENLPAEFLCDHDPSLGTLRTMLTWCDIMPHHAGLCNRWSWPSQCQDSGCLSFSDLQHCQVHTGRTVPEEGAEFVTSFCLSVTTSWSLPHGPYLEACKGREGNPDKIFERKNAQKIVKVHTRYTSYWYKSIKVMLWVVLNTEPKQGGVLFAVVKFAGLHKGTSFLHLQHSWT